MIPDLLVIIFRYLSSNDYYNLCLVSKTFKDLANELINKPLVTIEINLRSWYLYNIHNKVPYYEYIIYTKHINDIKIKYLEAEYSIVNIEINKRGYHNCTDYQSYLFPRIKNDISINTFLEILHVFNSKLESSFNIYENKINTLFNFYNRGHLENAILMCPKNYLKYINFECPNSIILLVCKGQLEVTEESIETAKYYNLEKNLKVLLKFHRTGYKNFREFNFETTVKLLNIIDLNLH